MFPIFKARILTTLHSDPEIAWGPNSLHLRAARLPLTALVVGRVPRPVLAVYHYGTSDVLCCSSSSALLVVLFGRYRTFKFLEHLLVEGEGRQPGAWWPPGLMHREGETCMDDKSAYK